MKARYTLTLIYLGMLSVASYSVQAADIFSDSFETGDLSASNSYGFSWSDSAWTTIVTETHEVFHNYKTVNYTKENAANFPGKTWIPKTGSHSMRFRYSAGESWSEQRFDLGTPMKDVWIRLWVMVPVNFSYGPTGNVNKFFALYSDGYSQHGDGSTVWLGMERRNSVDASLWFSYSGGNYTTSGSTNQTKPFITTSDRGRWMHIVFHVKTESSSGASDGAVQTYRRWQGEINYTKLHEASNLPIKLPNAGPNGLKAGYILGWHQPYTNDTEWLVDDFVVSNSSPMGALTGKLPNPPMNLVILK